MSSQKTPLLQNNNREDEKIKHVQKQIQDNQQLMQQNIHQAIQRGQDLNELDDKSLMLENESVRFKERSTAVKKNMCFNRYRQMALIILVVIGIIAFISLMIYLAVKK